MHCTDNAHSIVNTLRKGKGVVFCVKIELASLQGLKGEPSNKIDSRNRHHSHHEKVEDQNHSLPESFV